MAKIARNYFRDLSDPEQVTMQHAVIALGLIPDNIAVDFEVERTGDGRTVLHLTEHLLTEQGNRYLDPDTEDIACQVHALDVDPELLPASVRP